MGEPTKDSKYKATEHGLLRLRMDSDPIQRRSHLFVTQKCATIQFNPIVARMRELRKFMVTIDETVFDDLQRVARAREITIQELLRAIVIPDWMDRARVEKPWDYSPYE
jgi:hypothetical protein